MDRFEDYRLDRLNPLKEAGIFTLLRSSNDQQKRLCAILYPPVPIFLIPYKPSKIEYLPKIHLILYNPSK